MLKSRKEPGDVIIGLEVHVQLNKLNSKLFCGCSPKYHDAEPNTHTCPVCLGLPGALPVLNEGAVVDAVKVALALNCKIEERTLFYRKNYYYLDLPKGFQISQYDYPIAIDGKISVNGTGGGERHIRIRRVHIEEDPARLVHKGPIECSRYSLIDYNRSGVALIEVVTEPDLRSPKEAREFLNVLRNILEYLDVFDESLEGALRVDANISLAGGTRTEVKNISSYRGVEKALLFEIVRQKNLVRRGIKITQETRHYDEKRGVTISLRTKEEEQDYRYFPEPDLVPLGVCNRIDDIRESLPELPDTKRQRFVQQYGISEYHAKVLTSELRLSNFFETVASEIDPILSATWIADVLKGELNYRGLGISAFPPKHMIQILQILRGKNITEKSAVQVIRTILDRGGEPADIIKQKGLIKVEESTIAKAVAEAIKENPAAVQDCRNGKNEALHFLMGQVMKKTHGRADPNIVNKLLKEKLQCT
ncbi:MAG: Asp-tRNA(Asn)/Glu-tRNA(Gln) amidotransferase subunit GatB [Methanosarcinales archaeon Met12]|nr:MAG: Asp-tRNA(Asn)/Glu-tRNA(Gln) amidotransferase subunit GatB [Methanosarcinales archaeon Met12]